MMTQNATMNSFDCCQTLQVNERPYRYFSLESAERAGAGTFSKLPFWLKVLAENLLRHEDNRSVCAHDITRLGSWCSSAGADTVSTELAFRPNRIIMPDASGVPLLVDLCAMRDAIQAFGGDPNAINPLIPVDFIVDHSVIAEHTGTADARTRNLALEHERNAERFAFLKWSQKAFDNIRVVPPGNGIMHQINLEYLGQVVWTETEDIHQMAYPDTLLGMDSHTTMINALGIMGWGVGGIEAAAAMLGQPVSIRLPRVVGCRLCGSLQPGVTATDLVLTVTEALRAHGVVQTFVEFCGDGLDHLSLPERATLANMAPEYGATMGFFAIDAMTLEYLHRTGRSSEQVSLVEHYAKTQGLWRESGASEPVFSDIVEIDLSGVEACVAGPARPEQRTPLSQVPASFERSLQHSARVTTGGSLKPSPMASSPTNSGLGLEHGAVTIAAITSCTNTSNPAVLIAAGLLARKANSLGLRPKPWVKTSLSPGSRAVGAYLQASGLQDDLDALGFNLTGFGCMTCMGASGPLAAEVETAIERDALITAAVLSGNRNFEARIHPLCSVNYLASPPLVVAYALAGNVKRNLHTESLGLDKGGAEVYLRDLWPDESSISEHIERFVTRQAFLHSYEQIADGGPAWDCLPTGKGKLYQWDPKSTYLRRPPYFEQMPVEAVAPGDIHGARVLVMAGDSVTTDHISPVSVIGASSPAGRYLNDRGVAQRDFNNYMTRRANHEVMIRGTFGNIRFRNELVPDIEGGVTRHMPSGEQMTIYDAALRYASKAVPLVIVAGKAYGTGSSRDWAAKGTSLLGVRAVLAESLERIHRSNLAGMGVLPLQFKPGVSRHTLDLDGTETFDILGLHNGLRPGMPVDCVITRSNGTRSRIELICRLDTALEVDYYNQGGILRQALRSALAEKRNH